MSRFSALWFFCLSFCLAPFFCPAQQTGQVDFPELGISFAVPSGWVGQVMEEAFLMGHQSKPGFILLTTHEAASIDEMKATAEAGLIDAANGIFLQPAGPLETIGNKGIGGLFSGNLGGQAAQAYLIGLINPHGSGVLIMSATSTELWSDQYPDLALTVAQSVQFSAAETPKVSAQGGSLPDWQNRLGNTRLTYMDSYSSYDYSNADYTTGGGYSNEETIDLCKAGYFNFDSNHSMSVTGGPAASAYSNGNQQGAGTWTVRAEPNGNKVLVLTFYSGEVKEYVLSYPNNEMHLNGYRYYHTWEGEYAPNCY